MHEQRKPIVPGCMAIVIQSDGSPEFLNRFVLVVERAEPGLLSICGNFTDSNDWLVDIEGQDDGIDWYFGEHELMRIDPEGDEYKEFEEDFDDMMVEAFIKVASKL